MIPEWVLFHPTLDALDVRVYGVLARYGERSFPSLGTVGEKVSRSEDSVRRSIARLVDAGAVAVEQSFSDSGRQNTNTYTLAGEAPMRVAPSTDATLPLAPTRGGEGRADATLKRAREERELFNENKDLADADAPTDPVVTVIGSDDALFDSFWSVYPRKTGKPAARRAFGKAMRVDGRPAVSAGFARWRDHWRSERTGLQFIPHPATWLNDKRYFDTPAPSSVRQGRQQVHEVLSGLRYDAAGAIIEG